MNIPWRMPKELEARVIESLLDPSFVSDEDLEALLKSPSNVFSCSFLSSEGFGGTVDVTFDLLLEAGNQRAIKAYIKEGDHYHLALMCSGPLRDEARRDRALCKMGYFDRDEPWPGYRDYIYDFAYDNVVDSDDEDGWDLTPSTQAVSDYVYGQFKLYDNTHDSVFQATTRDGKKLYDGPDRLEMYEALYKELIK